MFEKIRTFSRLVVLSHSVFALPFALASLLVATQGRPSFRLLGLVVLAMVLARTTAMAYNRFADADIDAQNPRTKDREIPAGRVSLGQVRAIILACAAGFIAVCYFINPLAFKLAPLALFIILFYSRTKRFTWTSHFFLGLALGAAPVGAWIAATGQIAFQPFWLMAAVVCFVAGFDILYATQDADFDRSAGLHSWVVKWGGTSAVWTSRFLHVAMLGFLAGFGVLAGFPNSHVTGIGLIAAALVYQHRTGYRIEGSGKGAKVILSPQMMAMNGWIAVLYLVIIVTAVWSAKA